MKTFKEFLNESSHRPKWKKVNDAWHTTPITTFKDTMDAINNKQPRKSELHIDVSRSNLDPRDYFISHRSSFTLEPDKNRISSQSGIRDAKKYASKVVEFHKKNGRLPGEFEVSIHDD